MSDFNDAIEAAAKWHDEVVAECKTCAMTEFNRWLLRAHEASAEKIRALKRPEPCLSNPAPGDTQAGLSLTDGTQRAGADRGIDRLYAMADQWLAEINSAHMSKAIAASGSPESVQAIMHLAFVEGAFRAGIKERADVVAWLRRDEAGYPSPTMLEADQIQRGEHIGVAAESGGEDAG